MNKRRQISCIRSDFENDKVFLTKRASRCRRVLCKNLNLTLQTMAFGQDLSDSKGSTAKPAQEKR
jgi:hypothetical protein